MRIGVIADTHIPVSAKELPKQLYKGLENVELILHAGDLIILEVLENLERIAKVRAVFGNMDSAEVKDRLPEKEIIEMGGYRIGLIHGYGRPEKLMEVVRAEFNKKVDGIVYGHSHSPLNETRDGLLFFNPGSPTDRIFAAYNSYGILELGENMEGRIIRI